MRVAALLLFGMAVECFVAHNNSYGQTAAASTADRGVTCVQLIEKRFSAYSIPTEMARFEIHVRILPFVGEERQISLVYDLNRKAQVRIVTFDGSLCTELADFERKNRRLPNENEIAHAQPRIVDLEIDPALAKRWMARFWKEVGAVARSSPAVALEGETKGEVSVTLDPNVYEFTYTDNDKSLKLTLAGPNPDRVRGPKGLEPLVRWAIAVARQCETIQRSQSKWPCHGAVQPP